MKKLNYKGITLIALIITIIILLILAGVTILALTGDNGILEKGKKANEETNKQTATEIMNLKITNAQIKSYSETQEMPSLQYLADRLCEDGDIEYVELETKKKSQASIIETFLPVITVKEGSSIFTKLKEYPYEFEIDGNLKLASINGIKIADANAEKINKLEAEIEELKEMYKNVSNKPSQPVGTVISYMGNNVPDGYLACNGQTYNISEYSSLAEQIKKEFGSYNYYGGNGTTTFATPNLTGKFLKGSNTAGVNENAGLPNITGTFRAYEWDKGIANGAFSSIINTPNCVAAGNSSQYNSVIHYFDASRSSSIYGKSETVTPENMSVLYCIKH